MTSDHPFSAQNAPHGSSGSHKTSLAGKRNHGEDFRGTSQKPFVRLWKRAQERVRTNTAKEEQGMVSSKRRANGLSPPALSLARSIRGSNKHPSEAALEHELDEWANAGAARAGTLDGDAHEAVKEPLKKLVPPEYSNLQQGADRLPSMEVQLHLAGLFFDVDSCHMCVPLRRSSFLNALKEGRHPPVLVLAICAISARLSSNPAARDEPAYARGEAWASAAEEIAVQAMATPDTTLVIVYLMLAQVEYASARGQMLIGMAVRMAYALGLHHEVVRDTSDGKNGQTHTDPEIRRRTMWSCFLMDLLHPSSVDVPPAVYEQEIRLRLPTKDSYFQANTEGAPEDLEGNVPNEGEAPAGRMADERENMGVTAYLIRLMSLWGKVVAYIRGGGKDRYGHPIIEMKQ
ncbi:uncharacterized protein LTR77_010960 [Saxophila tyrrhenica]|uniref:Xylanolytic transcriptional activator regulatory domain-containing protein n=1 Tax=Saxophila tyrrhenica TaxID=1690608 RepID=A0AAV9NU88_9PEZI|nr:hypothetical protein LTR77_010960 [Saxophila tyrrhenica]